MVYAERDGDNNRIILTTTWTEKEQVKLVPGTRWDPTARMWTAPLSWSACLQLRGIFGENLTVGEELTKWSWQTFNERVHPANELRNLLIPTDEMTNSKSLISGLYGFQRCGSTFMHVAGNALLSDQLGTGKTVQTLAALKLEGALPALVICPNSVKTGWEKQTRKWYPEATPYVVHGSAAKRRKTIEEAKADPTALVIINIEAVRLFSRLSSFGSIRLARCRACDPRGEEGLTPARCEVHRKALNDFGFQAVILDEAHRIKDPQAKSTRACWAVGHDSTVRRRWALTGTPIANHVGDLWSIMHFLEPNEWSTKSKAVDRYALQSWSPYGGLDIVGINPQTREEFYKILDPRFRRTLKAQVLDQLPPVVHTQRWVDMTPKQAKAYRELELQLITRLDTDEVLIAPNNLVKATRLLQLSSSYADVEWVSVPLTVLSKCSCYGAGYDEHADSCPLGTKIVVTLSEPSPKLDAMEEILEELGDKQVVIAAESRQLIDLAGKRLEKLNISHGYITGAVNEYERQRFLDRFQRGDVQVMLITIGAGGEGIDGLQVSDTMIMLQRSWKMIANVQVDGRVHRIGSEQHTAVTIIDIITHDTIEETTLYPRLALKLERLDEITRDRVKLAALGQSSAQLDDEESQILSSHLGMP